MIDGYPDEDSPYTFYFNGEEMPKWTSTWCLIPVDFWGEQEDWIADLCWRIYVLSYCLARSTRMLIHRVGRENSD